MTTAAGRSVGGALAGAAAVLAAAAGLAGETSALDRWALWGIAVALAVASWASLRGAVRFGAIAGMLIAGSAGQLYLTEALYFPKVHLRPDDWGGWVAIALVGAEAAVAAAALLQLGMERLVAALRRWGPTLLGVLVVGGLLSVSVMGFQPRGAWGAYAVNTVVGGALIAVHLAAVVALLMQAPPLGGMPRLSAGLAAAIVLVAAAALAWFGFAHLPHVEDELAYLFQARTFAGGHLAAPAPPEAVRPMLDYYLLTVDGARWFAVTAPGWPAVLALGAAVGAEWLVNPLLAAIAAFLALRVAARLGGTRVMQAAAVLLVASPWFLAAGATLMTHALTIALVLGAWWAVLCASDPRRPGGTGLALAVVAGLAMGWVFATRPLDGVIAGALTGIWLIAERGTAGQRLARGLGYAAGCLGAGSGYFLYNRAMTGDLMVAPLDAYLARIWGKGANSYGFGPDVGPPAGSWKGLDPAMGHSPLEGLVNTANNLSSLQFELFGWGIGSLALIVVLFIGGRLTRTDRALVGLCLVTIGAMFLYWFAGSFYIGPRYWYLVLFPAIYLSARGAVVLAERIGTDGEARVGSALVVLAVISLGLFTPWRAVAKYHAYEDVHGDIRAAANGGQFGSDVVLVTDEGDPASYFVLNSPWLEDRSRPVFLTDTGTGAEAAAQAAFPGRKVVRYTSDWKKPR